MSLQTHPPVILFIAITCYILYITETVQLVIDGYKTLLESDCDRHITMRVS